MDRRGFLQAAAVSTAATLAGRSALAAQSRQRPAEKAQANPAMARRPRARSEVKPSDTWDLASLFPTDAAWEEAFAKWQKQIDGYAAFQGKLAQNAETLAECLRFHLDVDRVAERLGTYAQLKVSQDTADGTYQRMAGRFTKAASRMGQASSFIRPEVLAIPAARMQDFLAVEVLAPYKLLLKRILRFKPHTLGEKEERLLAMQSEMAEAASKIFRQLLDADLKFGSVADERGERVELSHASYLALLQSPSAEVRRNAFHTYYEQFSAHKNTLAASLSAAVQRDIYYAKARNYPSALEAALFPDVVPAAVYDHLIASVHRQLPALYRYYDLRRRKMNLKEIHQYDTYVPILAEMRTRHTWDQAVDVVVAALAPLGSDYCGVLEMGLRGRWCDRYENRGKRSGAFSNGSYDADPYILMNYQPEVLDHVFTLAHEAGHSMHSYLSAKNQPFAYFNYSLFVAEVASTFNEQLLSRHLLAHARDKRERALYINRQIDAMRGTLFRQTMFAEFEKLAHASAEAGEPLTLERITGLYHDLLRLYFGPNFTLDPELDLECLRVPHFYRGFYVYKYATGLSAAMALADRVTKGGQRELEDYLGFLKGGCSKDPLDLLRGAGVDMERPEAIDAALARFGRLVEELEGLI
jgi:oligoendopeptidase F